MDPAGQLMRGTFEIVGAIVGIALIALLINRSQGTAQVVQAGASSLDRLLRTVTLQNQFGVYSGGLY
jgi:hypothetical protein